MSSYGRSSRASSFLGGRVNCYDNSYLSEFVFQKYWGLLQNLGFMKARLSRKPGNRKSRVMPISKHIIFIKMSNFSSH